MSLEDDGNEGIAAQPYEETHPQYPVTKWGGHAPEAGSLSEVFRERNTEPVWKDVPLAVIGRNPIQNVLRTLPQKADDRKLHPVMTGVVDYFPLAIAAVARISKAGNDQHNPGQPLHWARGKSTDHADCVLRHLIERGTIDTDGMRHSAKMAWRALALLQEELEREANWTPEV